MLFGLSQSTSTDEVPQMKIWILFCRGAESCVTRTPSASLGWLLPLTTVRMNSSNPTNSPTIMPPCAQLQRRLGCYTRHSTPSGNIYNCLFSEMCNGLRGSTATVRRAGTYFLIGSHAGIRLSVALRRRYFWGASDPGGMTQVEQAHAEPTAHLTVERGWTMAMAGGLLADFVHAFSPFIWCHCVMHLSPRLYNAPHSYQQAARFTFSPNSPQ